MASYLFSGFFLARIKDEDPELTVVDNVEMRIYVPQATAEVGYTIVTPVNDPTNGGNVPEITLDLPNGGSITYAYEYENVFWLNRDFSGVQTVYFGTLGYDSGQAITYVLAVNYGHEPPLGFTQFITTFETGLEYPTNNTEFDTFQNQFDFDTDGTITSGPFAPGENISWADLPGVLFTEDDVLRIARDDGHVNTRAGADFVRGSFYDDSISGGSGRDTLDGSFGNDALNGNRGNDLLRGEHGSDTLFGNKGNDQLIGGRGRDLIEGGNGADIVRAGAGPDTVTGGNGTDTLTGGDGPDVFLYRSGFGLDIITDFSAGDRIDLNAVAAIRGFNDLKDNHLSEMDGSAIITAGLNQITLAGVAMVDLERADFLF